MDFRFLGIDLAALAPFGSGAEWVEPSERSRDEMNWCAVGWRVGVAGSGGLVGFFMGWAGRRVNDARGRCCCGLCLGQAGLRLRPAGRRGHWVSWWLDRGRPPAAGFWFGFFVRPKSNDLPCRVDR